MYDVLRCMLFELLHDESGITIWSHLAECRGNYMCDYSFDSFFECSLFDIAI